MADVIVILTTLAVAAFVGWKGGGAERCGALLVAFTALVYLVLCHAFGRAATAYSVDASLLLGFGAIYLRFRQPWVLSALCVRLAAAPLHMLILTGEGGFYTGLSRLNLPAYATLACLLLGLYERRRRLTPRPAA